MSEPNAHDPAAEADDRVVDAMLVHLCDPDAAAARSARIGRAMDAIARSSPARSVGRRRIAWAAVAAVAAVIAVTLTRWTPSTANASIADIVAALDRPGDRTYRVHVEPSDVGPQTRHGLDGATLYLRSRSEFVLCRVTPRGEELFDGYDGRHSWRVRQGLVVESRNGPGAGKVPVPQVMSEVPFIDLRRTLGRLQSDYVLDRFDLASLPGHGGVMRHVLVRRRTGATGGPPSVEIWADRDTGVPERIVFGSAKFQGSPVPRTLTFDLSASAALPADWFAATRHTHGRVPVPGTRPEPRL